MKKIFLYAGIPALLLVGALSYSFASGNCPLQGTADCPKVENCPLKGTPECPLVKDGKAAQAADCCKATAAK